MILADTLPATLAARAAATPDQPAFWSRDDTNDQWWPTTWGELHHRAHNLASQLRLLGIGRGDRVALSLPTTIEWEYAQHAILAAGGVVVGLDAHETDENLRHALLTVQPRALIVDTQETGEKLHALANGTNPRLIVAKGPVNGEALHLDELLARPTPITAGLPETTADDVATIIFTSGSTGRPKGIAYTHGQLALVGRAILERFPRIDEKARLACWLPLANLFQRVINFCGLICGAQSWFVEHPARIMQLLPEIQPSLFIGVPRFFEKLHAGLVAEIDKKPAPIRAVAHIAWRTACAVCSAERAGRPTGRLESLVARLGDRLILSRIRALMGPNLMFMVSGSAPMPTWLLERLHGLGWLVLEAYGISENAVPIAINTPEAYRFGSVGRPLEHNELRIATDGEILVRGSGVFSGYYGASPTESLIDEAGFLHTGDLGQLDEKGFLWLTGRKSELFKTSTGRRIAPAPIEALIKSVPHVEHAILIGRNRPFPVAIVDLDSTPPSEPPPGQECSSSLNAWLECLGSQVADACSALPPYQRPAGVLVSTRPFSVDGGQLTANQKLRRHNIERAFEDELDALYASLGQTQGLPHPPLICRLARSR